MTEKEFLEEFVESFMHEPLDDNDKRWIEEWLEQHHKEYYEVEFVPIVHHEDDAFVTTESIQFVTDESIPEGEAHFKVGDKLVGKLIDIE